MQGAFHGNESGSPLTFIIKALRQTEIHAEAQIKNALLKGKDTKNKNTQFIFEIGSNYFLEIAKLRAFRILWNNVSNINPYIFAQTTLSNKEHDFPYNNLLRSTTEGMAAIFGGCDGLLVYPYNKSFEAANDFSNRIA